MAFWSTKAAISLKRVKIQQMLLCEAYRNSVLTFALSNGTIPDPLWPLLPEDRVPTPPKTPIAVISGTGKAMNFKYGQKSNRTKAHETFWRKGSVGVSRDCPNFFGYPLLSEEWVKLRISHLAGVFRGSIRTKAH